MFQKRKLHMQPAYICEGVRTPIGRYGGALATVRADDLAAHPLSALRLRFDKSDWEAIDEVVLGGVNQAGEDNRNVSAWQACWPAFLVACRRQRQPALCFGDGGSLSCGQVDYFRRNFSRHSRRGRKHIPRPACDAEGVFSFLAGRQNL
jgi:hypothetical protein